MLVLPQKPRLTRPNISHPICPSSRVKCSPLRMWGGKAEWPALLTNPVSPLPGASLTSEALLVSPYASEMFPKTPPFFCNTSLHCQSGRGPLLSYPLPGAPIRPCMALTFKSSVCFFEAPSRPGAPGGQGGSLLGSISNSEPSAWHPAPRVVGAAEKVQRIKLCKSYFN